MTCRNKDIRQLLPAHLEGALDPSAQREVEQHLAACHDCRTEIDMLRLLAAENVPDPGEAFWAALPGRIYREVQEQQRGTGRLTWALDRFLRVRWALAAMAAVLLVVSLAWFLTSSAPMKLAETVPADSTASYDDMLDPGTIEVAELGDTELRSLDAWASGELVALIGEASDLITNSQDLSLDDRLAELNPQELEQLSHKLDEYAEEG